MILLFIGGVEIFVIGLIVVMLFGADKIPELARGLGKGMRQLRDVTDDLKRDIKESAEDNNIIGEIKEEMASAKKDISEFTRPIKKQITDNIPDIKPLEDIKDKAQSITENISKVSNSIKRKR